jgi:lipopolysaccharide assembly outer membrane protein LptD (OstA)
MKILTYSLFIPFIACSLLSFSRDKAHVSNYSLNSFDTVPDSLPAIKYYAKDSTQYSNDKNIISLFGDAKIMLNDITVVADAIVYNASKQTLKVTNVNFFEFRGNDEKNKIQNSTVTLKITAENYEIIEGK